MKLNKRSFLYKLIRFKRRQIRRLRHIIRHPGVKVPIITLLSLSLITLVLYHFVQNSKTIKVVPNSKIVIISHDGVQQVVPTKDKTVKILLTKLHIVLHHGDVVEPALNTAINQDDFRINIFRAKPIAINTPSGVVFSYSAAKTPRAVVQQSGVKIYPEDYVYATPTTNFLKSGVIGQSMVINPATPINLNLYGKNILIRTHAKTVAELIKKEHIKLGSKDEVVPALNSSLSANQVVYIVSQGIKITTITQSIPMPIQTIYSSSLAYGTSAVRQQGSAGQEVITYEDQTKHNLVVSSTELQTIVTVQPVMEIVVEGTSLSGIKGDMALAGISSNDYQYADYIISHESGWCPTKAQGEHYCPAIPDNAYTPYGYGLCQATPGYKMSSAGADWATNPITQLEWCNSYAVSRYGGWYNAYIHWINNGNW